MSSDHRQRPNLSPTTSLEPQLSSNAHLPSPPPATNPYYPPHINGLVPSIGASQWRSSAHHPMQQRMPPTGNVKFPHKLFQSPTAPLVSQLGIVPHTSPASVSSLPSPPLAHIVEEAKSTERSQDIEDIVSTLSDMSESAQQMIGEMGFPSMIQVSEGTEAWVQSATQTGFIKYFKYLAGGISLMIRSILIFLLVLWNIIKGFLCMVQVKINEIDISGVKLSLEDNKLPKFKIDETLLENFHTNEQAQLFIETTSSAKPFLFIFSPAGYENTMQDAIVTPAKWLSGKLKKHTKYLCKGAKGQDMQPGGMMLLDCPEGKKPDGRCVPWCEPHEVEHDGCIGLSACLDHCNNHGFCFNGRCLCLPGWDGERCEKSFSLVDKIERMTHTKLTEETKDKVQEGVKIAQNMFSVHVKPSHPCQDEEGAVCSSHGTCHNRKECSCKSGWGGAVCGEDLNLKAHEVALALEATPFKAERVSPNPQHSPMEMLEIASRSEDETSQLGLPLIPISMIFVIVYMVISFLSMGAIFLVQLLTENGMGHFAASFEEISSEIVGSEHAHQDVGGIPRVPPQSLRCPQSCSFQGECIHGHCVCYSGFTSEDCSVSLDPTPLNFPEEGQREGTWLEESEGMMTEGYGGCMKKMVQIWRDSLSSMKQLLYSDKQGGEDLLDIATTLDEEAAKYWSIIDGGEDYEWDDGADGIDLSHSTIGPTQEGQGLDLGARPSLETGAIGLVEDTADSIF